MVAGLSGPAMAEGLAALTARSGQMEYRQLGNSGLNVPVLTFGTGTFGGQTDFFKPWGVSRVPAS